jgi:hypothetical protein
VRAADRLVKSIQAWTQVWAPRVAKNVDAVAVTIGLDQMTHRCRVADHREVHCWRAAIHCARPTLATVDGSKLAVEDESGPERPTTTFARTGEMVPTLVWTPTERRLDKARALLARRRRHG